MSHPNSNPAAADSEGDQLPADPAATDNDSTVAQVPGKTRLRIRFTKCGDLRWISHRDLARVWERLLRRAGLQLAFSQGFHPKPKISFPSALALGIEALDEVIELEVLGVVELASIDQLLRREMPEGMQLLELRALETALGKAKVLGASYRIPHTLVTTGDALKNAEERASHSTASGGSTDASLPAESHGDDQPTQSTIDLQRRLDEILQLPMLQLERDGKTVACETTDPYFDLKIESEYFVFSLPTLAQGSIRPSELLAHVGLGQLLEDGWTLQRTAVHLLEPDGLPVPP